MGPGVACGTCGAGFGAVGGQRASLAGQSGYESAERTGESHPRDRFLFLQRRLQLVRERQLELEGRDRKVEGLQSEGGGKDKGKHKRARMERGARPLQWLRARENEGIVG